jgi:CheY-like chemotaxis protein
MLELSPATLRNWEQRYRIVEPQRSQGGHRLYSRDDVERLRFIVSRLEDGLQPGEAHLLLAERLEQGLPLMEEGAAAVRLLVLVAERDPLAAELSECFLRTEGFDVVCALDAVEATALFTQLRPQIALVDLLISGGAGLELCRRLKQAGEVAVIAISTLATSDVAMSAGADAFLPKPIDPLQLVSTVRDLAGMASLTARRAVPA